LKKAPSSELFINYYVIKENKKMFFFKLERNYIIFGNIFETRTKYVHENVSQVISSEGFQVFFKNHENSPYNIKR
jgi:hypothetical protein